MEFIHKIAYAIDSSIEGKIIINEVFPIWQNDTLAKLTNVKTGDSVKVLLGDLFEDYTLLDHDRNVIHTPEMIAED
jgi:hypothetical protein